MPLRFSPSLIRQLVDSQVRLEDIAVLSTRRPENSFLAGCRNLAGHRLVEPMEDESPRPGDLLFSTMHAFKGLERQAVIAVDMAEIGDDILVDAALYRPVRGHVCCFIFSCQWRPERTTNGRPALLADDCRPE